MDIYQLAKRTFPINITMLNSHKTVQELKRDAFVKGYKASTTWHPMEEAPKDGIKILAEFRNEVDMCYWSGDYWRSATNGNIIYPIAWTHLPVYNP